MIPGFDVQDLFLNADLALVEAQQAWETAAQEADRVVRSKWFRDHALTVQRDHLASLGGRGETEAESWALNYVPSRTEQVTGRMDLATVRALAERNALGGAGILAEVLDLFGMGCAEGLASFLPKRDRLGRLRAASLTPPVFIPSREEIAADVRAEVMAPAEQAMADAEALAERESAALALYESGQVLLGAGGAVTVTA